ncbi:MAG: DUF445 domain-containing protein [Chitinophagaceae bacterium]
MNYWLLLIPFLSAITGWITIRMAVWLLFHPRQPKTILGWKIQGLWPARREQIALQAGNYAAAAFPLDELEQRINEPGRFEEIKPIIEEHMDHFLRHKLKEQMPMIAMFIGDKTIQSLKTIFIQEIESLFPQVIGRFAGNLKKELKLNELVSAKLAAIPTHSIEQAVRRELAPKLRLAALFGGFIGLIIGILQLLIVLLL